MKITMIMLLLTAALGLSQETKPNSEAKKTGDQVIVTPSNPDRQAWGQRS